MPPVEMAAASDFVTPTLNGQPYIVKPPLLYWLIAGVYSITGTVSALTARIPTALCALLLTLSLYTWARRTAGRDGAMWAAVGLIGSYYFLERARWAMLDVPLALGVFGAIVLWRESTGTRGVKAALLLVAAAVSFAAALLFKGPPAFIFLWAAWVASAHAPKGEDPRSPARWVYIVSLVALLFEAALYYGGVTLPLPIALIAAMGAWTVSAFMQARSRAVSTFATLAFTLGVGCALAAPWAVSLVNALGWDTIQAMLDEQVVERTYKASEINSGSPFFYIVLLPALCLPFGLLFPLQANPKFWSGAPDRIRFAGMTGWVAVLAFSLIAGKESEYVLPAFPFLLTAMGWRLSMNLRDAEATPNPGYYRFWSIGLAALVVIVAIGGIVAAVMLGHTILIVETVVLGLCAVALVVVALRSGPSRRVPYAAAGYICILAAVYALRAFDYTGVNSPRALGEVAGAYMRAGTSVEIHRLYPGVTFYAEQPVTVLPNPRNAREKMEGEAPYVYIIHGDDRDRFLERLGREPAFVSAPYTSKRLTLIANTPLPSEVADALAPYASAPPSTP